MRQRAFTLVELMISVALGVAVVGVAFAGVRVASASVAASSRIEIENAIMREGCLRAFERVDFWTDCDVPGSYEPLRAIVAGRGLAFAPMSLAFPGAAGAGEAARGWDGDEAAWAPHDPRAWMRGSMIERPQSQDVDLRFGRYGLFSNLDAAPVAPPVGGVDYGAVQVERTWHANQLRGLIGAIGWYGFIEYLPANAIYTWYETPSARTTAGGIPFDLVRESGADGVFCFENANQGSRGRYRMSHRHQFAMPAPLAGGDYARDHYRWFSASFGGDAATMRAFDGAATARVPLLPLAPAHWPSARVSVTRYVMNARATALCRVRWTSPLTGHVAEASFSAWGTSLRGARQQRRHPDQGGGWIEWHNDGRTNPRDLDAP
ncbi:MAG TPA: prepilin-type N-terminal cleavage/methylation domain-containing protein [Planctomycetota bacterium]|nr:prepilin-type N-terminal cleavage/methylation domain-containing protein [Planctomycetota bacterium]